MVSGHVAQGNLRPLYVNFLDAQRCLMPLVAHGHRDGDSIKHCARLYFLGRCLAKCQAHKCVKKHTRYSHLNDLDLVNRRERVACLESQRKVPK